MRSLYLRTVRHGDNHRAVRRKYAREFGDRFCVVLDMFDDVGADDEVVRTVLERQVGDGAGIRLHAAVECGPFFLSRRERVGPLLLKIDGIDRIPALCQGQRIDAISRPRIENAGAPRRTLDKTEYDTCAGAESEVGNTDECERELRKRAASYAVLFTVRRPQLDGRKMPQYRTGDHMSLRYCTSPKWGTLAHVFSGSHHIDLVGR